MKQSKRLTIAMLAASCFACSGALADTVSIDDYYGFRTVVQYTGGSIDVGDENGLTSDQQTYTDSNTSVQGAISLADGALRNSTDVVGNGSIGLVNTQFGDTVTFSGGEGTTAEFSLDVDGAISADAATDLNSFQAAVVTARLALFDTSSGATLANWFDMGFGTGTITALDTDFFTYQAINNTEDVLEQIMESLSVSTVLGSDSQSFQIFAQLDLVGIRNTNVGRTTLDFMNTAQLSIFTDPNVGYTSASGVLLGGPTISAVPLPAAGWLLLAAFGGLAAAGRRKAT